MIETFGASRRDPALAVLEGFHAVKHAIRFGATFEAVAVRDLAAVAGLCARLAPDVATTLLEIADEVGADGFAELAPRPPHTGVLALARRPLLDAAAITGDAPAVLLEAPRHAANVGACVRVAAAAGAAGVIVTGAHDPWSPDALRGSAGLHFALPVVQTAAPPADRPLIAFDPDGAPFDPGALPRGAVLAFGTERSGLSDALKGAARSVVALPMQAGVSSLNLATSVSAALYAARLAGRPGACSTSRT